MKFTFAPESTPLEGYTIKRAIHRGGFGEVYYALSDAGKEVALKLLNNNLEVELRGVSQCLNLKHPNLVTIFDMKTDSDGDHWIVMEYVSGDCLDKVAARYPDGMPMEQVLKWLSGMTAGISFLHDRGIVHRDLKPANIFSDSSGVKIGDVGLSKFISESRRSAQTQSVGTVYYMAPEVARGRYGKEVDVYAMGVILYELVTGRVPYEGETTAEILMKHLSDRPNMEPLPERLRPVLSRALEKDPERRIPDAAQLEKEFRNAVNGVASSLPPLPPPPPPGNTRPEPVVQASLPEQLRETHVPTPPPIPATPVVAQSPGPIAWFSGLSPFAKCVIGGVAVVLFGRMGLFSDGAMEVLIPGLILGGIAYLGYRLWQSVFGPVPEPSVAPVAYRDNPAHPARDRRPGGQVARPREDGRPPFRRARAARPHALSPATERKVPHATRMMELTGGMTLAVFCSVVITALLGAAEVLRTEGQLFAFGSVTLIGSWAVMVVSKITEGRSLSPLAKRLSMGVAGLGVGVAAFFLNHVLFAEIPLGDHGSPILPQHEFSEPSLLLFAAFFAPLFVLRRWWWHTDSFRSKRLRVSTTLVTLLVAFAVSGFVGFDFIWGLTWATAISCVVQLSSSWTPAEDRYRVVNQMGMES